MFALGIGEVGSKTAKELAKHFKTFENIKNASQEEIANIYDIGDIIAQNIYNFFREEYNLQEIDRLFASGVTIKEVEKSSSNKFEGKTFVITGTLSQSRDKFEEMIEKEGGHCSSAVSKKTDFVLAGENAGSKLAKAKELGIKIISEEEFLNMKNN